MPVFCITGSNRGLGLEFVRQLSQSADNIILASARPSADLDALKAVSSASTHILDCDVEDVQSIGTFVRQASRVLDGNKVNYLVNNAGTNNTPAGESSVSLDAVNLARQLAVNVIGPAKVVEFLLADGLLAADVRVCNLTSGLGSMAVSLDMQPPKCVGYSISKAGLNMLAIHMASDLRARGLDNSVVIVMDPGWVKTRMGGSGAVLEPAASIQGMLRVLRALEHGDNARFYNYDGTTKPW